MQSLILSSNSNSDLELLLQLAVKMGIKAQTISEEQQEDIGLLFAMKEGKTNEYIETNEFLRELEK